MRGLRTISIFLLLASLLAGCELKSTRPLLDPAQAQLAFGPAFTAVMAQENDSLVDKNGRTFVIAGTASGNIYEMSIDGSADAGTMAFLPVGGMPFDYLLQMTAKDGFSYTAVRNTETGATVANIDLSDAVLKTLEQHGIRPIASGTDHRVESRGALDETVRAWAEALASKGGDTAFSFHFEIARGPRPARR
jgi:hypothetical protein